MRALKWRALSLWMLNCPDSRAAESETNPEFRAQMSDKPHHSHTIKELLAAVRQLPAITPQVGKLLLKSHNTFQEQWIGWLEEYDGPGYYGRGDDNRDARWVYQHLNNGNMIAWLNEAAGESPSTIEATITDMQRVEVKQSQAKIARSHLPWERVAKLLFD